MKRVFAAIELPDSVRDIVAKYSLDLAAEFPDIRIKLVARENLHITLYFAGSVDIPGLAEFTEAVNKAALGSPAFTISIDSTGAFVDRRHRSNTLWIAARETPGEKDETTKDSIMISLSRSIHRHMGRSLRRFVPHVTIARSKDLKNCGLLIEKHLASALKPISFEVADVLIYESTLLPTGPVYSVLSRHPLLVN